MNVSHVRCWKVYAINDGQVSDLFISYPEDNSGHLLLTCLNCGHVYSASVSKMVYVGPDLDNKLAGMQCLKCSISLASAFALYPDSYVTKRGIRHFDRPRQIPPDDQSVVKIFDEIY